MIEFLERNKIKDDIRDYEKGASINEVKNDIYLKEYYLKVFNDADVNKKGRINFRQFYEVFKKENTADNFDREKLKDAFKLSIDKDSNDKEIDFEIFFKLLVRINENFKDFLNQIHNHDSMELNDLKLGLVQENM